MLFKFACVCVRYCKYLINYSEKKEIEGTL